MSENSLDISRKIDDKIINVLEVINSVALSLDIPFFVVGATARDFMLEHCHNIKAFRATLDIDLGVRVPSWRQFAKLKDCLISTGKFSEEREQNRLRSIDDIQIDLIPFGPIASPKKVVMCPPNSDVVMSVLGFEESFQSSLNVTLRSDPLVQIKVVTIAGLALMKLISWKDKYPDRAKDASDLAIIIKYYANAGNLERIIDELPEFVESENFDLITAGAQLLGRDMFSIASEKSREIVLSILKYETDGRGQQRLIGDMMKTRTLPANDYANMMEWLAEIKKAFV